MPPAKARIDRRGASGTLLVGLVAGLVLMPGPGLAPAAPAEPPPRATPNGRDHAPSVRNLQASLPPMAFVALTQFQDFTSAPGRPSEPAAGTSTIFTSPVLDAPGAWDELILSWNVTEDARTAGFQFEARPILPGRETRFYHLGHWTLSPGAFRRESVNGQNDELAEVQTDTLLLRQPARQVQLRVTVTRPASAHSPALPLRLVGLSFLERSRFTGLQTTDPTKAGGTKGQTATLLPVPERSQVAHEGGREWCSPTSVSMVLAYWAARLGRRDLDRTVPEVAAGVNDPRWPGTGNWPFNTAYASSFRGLRAYVTRLADIRDLDALLDAGVPPIVSVSFDLLNGKDQDVGTGHLIVCVGRTAAGEFVINDPWAFLDRGERVQRSVPRERLARAWARSRGAVYLIHPDDWRLPAGGSQRWLTSDGRR